MNTDYVALPTAPQLLTATEQRATEHVTVADIAWDLLIDRATVLVDLPGTPFSVTGPVDDIDPCGGSGCLDGDECDTEYVITHRAHHGLLTYRTPVCRGCLHLELRHLHHPSSGADNASIRVLLPAPLVTQ